MFDVAVSRDVRIPTADAGVTLSADLYRPVVEHPAPALVTVTLSRKDTMDQAGDVRRWFAQHGYIGVLVDLRGTGLSDGTMRPIFDAGEADDALAAIAWVASQPWCDGNVGMWGFSSGATMTLRTASRRPPQLKAIMPIMGMLDPERDFVHPDGVRGGLASLAQWGSFNLMNQLLPPAHNFTGHDEHRRWMRRLAAEPSIIDFFRHGPGDPTWRDRAIDATSITVPALCVAGWNELLCEGSIRAFEQIQGPKKLLAGSWGHTLPHRSPFQAIDFLPIALRWWDHWLRGADNGAMDGPPVIVYVQGANGGWRSHTSWPPGKDEVVLTATAGSQAATSPSIDGAPGEPVAVAAYEPDPTVGTLTGWWRGFTDPLRLDQHDDDMRAARIDSEPLTSDVLITGRPEVMVRLANRDSADRDSDSRLPERLVVRLAEVDAGGRSTLITEGTHRLAHGGHEHTVTLWPTAYRIAAGQRLRVTICDAEFPRLWPSEDVEPVRLAQVELSLPILAEDGDEAGLPVIGETGAAKAPRLWRNASWEITRHPLDGCVQVAIGDEYTTYLPGGEHFHLRNSALTAKVCPSAPGMAVIQGTNTAQTRMRTGETIVAKVELRMTRSALWVNGHVQVDGVTVFSQGWTAEAH